MWAKHDSKPTDLSSTDDEKLLKDMPSEVYEKLTILLQPTHILGKDYRLLADKMGYKYEYIKYLESLPQPVKELFIKFAREERRTIKELLSLLKQIDRPDVVEDLQPYIGRINFLLLVVGGYKIFLVDIRSADLECLDE